MNNIEFEIKTEFSGKESYECPEDFHLDDETIITKGTELHLVTGVVLEPETTDAQGDIYNAEEIRKTAHQFMSMYQGEGNKLMHSKMNSGLRIVESYIVPVDMDINGNTIKKGTWLMTSLILDDKVWELVKTGKITGYSIGGRSNAVAEN